MTPCRIKWHYTVIVRSVSSCSMTHYATYILNQMKQVVATSTTSSEQADNHSHEIPHYQATHFSVILKKCYDLWAFTSCSVSFCELKNTFLSWVHTQRSADYCELWYKSIHINKPLYIWEESCNLYRIQKYNNKAVFDCSWNLGSYNK